MKYLKLLFALFFIQATYTSCNKDCNELSEFQEQYLMFLDNLSLNCINSTSPIYMKAVLLNEEVCYFDGEEGRSFVFGITSKFTSSSPEVVVGEIPKNVRKGALLEFPNYTHGDDFISIEFPDFPVSVDTIHYLDSIFAIREHKIMGENDIILDPNSDFTTKLLTKGTGGYLTKFKLNFSLYWNAKINGGGTYNISSIYGNQRDAYLRIIKANKIREKDGTYYNLEFDFQCTLYHFAQNGKSGIWSELIDGKFVGKIKASNR